MKRHIFDLVMQLTVVFVLSLIVFLLRPLPILYPFLVYVLVPFVSMYLAGKLVLKGINPYLTWILPSIGETAAGFLITMGIGPDPLPIMITAFVSLVGASAGDVIKKTKKKGKK